MAENFVIPNLGENIEQATIVSWLVEDGANVQPGDDVLELETDKAVIPVPAERPGFLWTKSSSGKMEGKCQFLL